VNMTLPVQDPVLQFTILISAALAMQLIAERARLPGLLGLLVLGAMLGPDAFDVLPREPVVSMLGEIGLIYVMFIAGLEIDFRVVREHRSDVATFGLLAFSLATPAALGAGLLLGFELAAAVLLGALIASHTLVSYPLLIRLGLLRRLSVITAVGGTLITDTLSLVVLAVVIALYTGNGAAGSLLPLLLLAGIAAGAYLVLPRTARAAFRSSRLSSAEKALFALVSLMVLAAATQVIGTEAILGAFLAGLLLNRPLEAQQDLREHLEFVGRMLFIPIFLVWTGTLLDPGVLRGDSRVWLVAGTLLAVLVAAKGATAWIAGVRFGHDWPDRFLMFGLTLPQAAATLAITITGREIGLFDVVVLDAVIVVIFVSCLAGAVITQSAGRRIRDRAGDEGTGEPVHPPVDEANEDAPQQARR
jgi:Kef-type K+ transport system membrane component KefB